MPEAFGDLGIAVQVDARPPQSRLLDEGREDEVAAVRTTVDGEAPVGPRLLRRPVGRIDHVVGVGVTPFVMVRQPERAAVAGGAAEVDVEDREALADEQHLERCEAPIRLPGRAAVRG